MSPKTLTLKPGQSGAFHVTAKTPDQPGDLSAAVELDTPLGAVSSVPFTLRSLITTANGGAFSGTIAGGNGRTKTLQSYVRAPEKGRWELVINVNQGVSGTVAAGKPITVQVKVRDNDVAPRAVFVDRA